MTAPIEQLIFAAKYPFSKTAKELIGREAVEIDFDAMERAKKRVIYGVMREDLASFYTNDQKLLKTEILSYPLAKMIASDLDRRFMLRYANAEIRRTLRYLRENESELSKICQEYGIENKGLNMALKSYLKYIPKNRECRLLSQNIKEGRVLLDPNKFLAVVGEAVRRTVEKGLPVKAHTIPAELKKDIEDAVAEVKEELKDLKLTERETVAVNVAGQIAPCMQKIMDKARNGENLSHAARVAVTTYLVKKLFPVDYIVELMSHTPNFNEKITRYQIDFIKKKGYNATSCMNMDSYGLRLSECGCLGTSGVKNPLYWGTRTRRKFEGEKRWKER